MSQFCPLIKGNCRSDCALAKEFLSGSDEAYINCSLSYLTSLISEIAMLRETLSNTFYVKIESDNDYQKYNKEYRTPY